MQKDTPSRIAALRAHRRIVVLLKKLVVSQEQQSAWLRVHPYSTICRDFASMARPLHPRSPSDIRGIGTKCYAGITRTTQVRSRSGPQPNRQDPSYPTHKCHSRPETKAHCDSIHPLQMKDPSDGLLTVVRLWLLPASAAKPLSAMLDHTCGISSSYDRTKRRDCFSAVSFLKTIWSFRG